MTIRFLFPIKNNKHNSRHFFGGETYSINKKWEETSWSAVCQCVRGSSAVHIYSLLFAVIAMGERCLEPLSILLVSRVSDNRLYFFNCDKTYYVSNPNPGYSTGGAGWGKARRGRAGPGRAGSGRLGRSEAGWGGARRGGARGEWGKAARNGSARRQPFISTSRTTKTTVLDVFSKARTKEILFKPNSGTRPPVGERLTSGWRAIYYRDDGRSSFLAADWWTDAFLSLWTLFMQGVSGNSTNSRTPLGWVRFSDTSGDALSVQPSRTAACGS